MNKKKLIWQLPFLVVLIVGTVIILKKQPPFRTDEGFIFGTVYKITYQSDKDLKKEIEKKTFEFQAKTGKEGRMFGQISVKQIKEALSKEGYDIDKKQIHLDHPIQSLGMHYVDIELHKKVIAKMKVHVK